MSMNWSELNMSEDSVKVFQELIERKEKLESSKRFRVIYLVFTGCLALFFAYSFYRTVMVGSGGNTMAMLDALFSDKKMLYTLALSVAAMLFTKNVLYRVEKAKKKYDTLREETIDRLEYSWSFHMSQEMRDQLSSYMKERHDINLRYKG